MKNIDFLKGFGSILSINPNTKVSRPSTPRELAEKSWAMLVAL